MTIAKINTTDLYRRKTNLCIRWLVDCTTSTSSNSSTETLNPKTFSFHSLHRGIRPFSWKSPISGSANLSVSGGPCRWAESEEHSAGWHRSSYLYWAKKVYLNEATSAAMSSPWAASSASSWLAEFIRSAEKCSSSWRVFQKETVTCQVIFHFEKLLFQFFEVFEYLQIPTALNHIPTYQRIISGMIHKDPVLRSKLEDVCNELKPPSIPTITDRLLCKFLIG